VHVFFTRPRTRLTESPGSLLALPAGLKRFKKMARFGLGEEVLQAAD
jgi:hypothetical protein